MDSVIIYRSRTEAEIDKMIWSGDGTFIEVFVCLGIWVGVFIMTIKLLSNYNLFSKYNSRTTFLGKNITPISFFVSLPITYLAYKLFFKLILL